MNEFARPDKLTFDSFSFLTCLKIGMLGFSVSGSYWKLCNKL